MDASLFALIAIIAIPAILLMALRINATLVFLSLCLGSVLIQFVADDASWIMGLFAESVPQAGSMTDATIKLILLFLPVVLTAVFMIKTVKGTAKLFMNVLPALGVGFLTALLAIPLLPEATVQDLTNSVLWQEVVKLQDLIVGASALLCLFVLWLQRPKTGGDKDKHHHH